MTNLITKLEELNPTYISACVITLAVVMGAYSLTSLNEKATKGYQVNKLESERQDLVRDGEITDMLNLRARSLESIKETDRVSVMVKPGHNEIVYVTPITVVAQK